MASDHFSRSSRYESNRSTRKSPSREKDRRRARKRNDTETDAHNERILSLRNRKRSRDHSPYPTPKKRRSRSAESMRKERQHGQSPRRNDYRDQEVYETRHVRNVGSRPRYNDERCEDKDYTRRERSRSRKAERSRRGSRDTRPLDERDDHHGKSRRSRRESRFAGSRSKRRRDSRRGKSREVDRRNELRTEEYYGDLRRDVHEREERNRDDRDDRYREEAYRSDRRGSEGRERTRNHKRSRSRSFRGNAKKSRRSSRPLVEDDEEGHLIFSKGDIIQDRYKILSELGEGTFGKVVKCEDLSKKKTIAIKIIKNVKKYRDAAKLEINVLSKLASYDPDCKFKCVQMYDWFDYHGHKCIAFQLLGKSVFDFLKDNNYEPYPLEHVRSIAYELCLSVNFIHSHRLTHTDLKPENILFYDSSKTKKDKKSRKDVLLNPEIRLIDFGSATFDHEHHSSIIQTRHYRAPEVILKLGWNQSCDTWSIGCIIIELALGSMLFDTHSSLEHLAMMERILGQIPPEMATRSESSYFKKGLLDWDTESKEGRYVRRKVKPIERYIPREERENKDWKDMFDLIRRMLEYDPNKRIQLPVAMEHPFLEKIALRKPSRSSSGYESR